MWQGTRLLNELFYVDNLEVLREHLAVGSVDLVYLTAGSTPLDGSFDFCTTVGRIASTNDFKPDCG